MFLALSLVLLQAGPNWAEVKPKVQTAVRYLHAGAEHNDEAMMRRASESLVSVYYIGAFEFDRKSAGELTALIKSSLEDKTKNWDPMALDILIDTIKKRKAPKDWTSELWALGVAATSFVLTEASIRLIKKFRQRKGPPKPEVLVEGPKSWKERCGGILIGIARYGSVPLAASASSYYFVLNSTDSFDASEDALDKEFLPYLRKLKKSSS